MKTQKNKTMKIIKITMGILALIIAIPFCMGMYAGFTSHTGTTGAVIKILKANCDCKSVDIDIASYGIQFSRKDGMTGSKATYILKDCIIKNTIKAEAEKVNTVLNAEVEGYEALDVVALHFVNDNNTEVVTIKKGTLLKD